MQFDREPPHQRVVMRTLSLITAMAGVLFFVINYQRGLYLLAGVEMSAAVLSLFVWFRVRTTPFLQRWAISYCIPFFLILLFALSSPGVHITVFVWMFIIPSMSYLLLGVRLGFCVTAVFEIASLLIFIYRYDPVLSDTSFVAVVNVGICCLMIWSFAHIYELTREKSHRVLMSKAAIDPLTGLLNRSRMKQIFSNEVEMAEKEGHGLCFVLLDLDYFKAINDQYGHDEGDKVLIKVARALEASIRESDHVFRVGGEEFCLILTNIRIDKAFALAEKIRLKIKKLNDGTDVHSITVSSGLVEWLGAQDTFESLFKEADARLYQAKNAGRNQVAAA